jgi:hypothetical protein
VKKQKKSNEKKEKESKPWGDLDPRPLPYQGNAAIVVGNSRNGKDKALITHPPTDRAHGLQSRPSLLLNQVARFQRLSIQSVQQQKYNKG